MAKVRSKKDHKKRVAKRNNILNQERKRVEKAQKEFIMKLIDEEKAKGLFNNPVEKVNDFSHLTVPASELPNLGILEGPKL